MTPSRTTGEWHGDGWALEVEEDCFDPEVGLVVSVWLIDGPPRGEALATLSPQQAREVADVLTACADYVEKAAR